MLTPRLITAIDTASLRDAQQLVSQLKPTGTMFKFGLEFLEAHGNAPLAAIDIPGDNIFIDHKWHDISATNAGAVRGLLQHLQPALVTVHALNGSAKLKQLTDFIRTQSPQTKVLGVTLLTDSEQAVLDEIGINQTPAEFIARLAQIAMRGNCDGVVCSGREAAGLRELLGPDALLVTPGIRLADSPADDQKRTVTPQAALAAGANYLVVGRPISNAPDPTAVATELMTLCEEKSLVK